MRHKSLSILIACLRMVSGACSKKPDAAFIFRGDGKFHGLAGNSGKAYRVSEGCMFTTSKGLSGDCKLDEIGTVDISKTDSDIAARFGVYEQKK